ncbi:MAG TPA: hypothetical protein PKU91_07550, partial [Phycisphaerales bacterium]|nr:hypothetical protein [Phycisphaerales bacterium]
PRSFWEEEFYFFPQLPQMLAQCGYTGACLFFQWTWHTPEIPVEPEPLIRWEGIDGTSLPALPRGELNVHQWPEDFDGLLDKVITSTGAGEASSPDAPSRVLDTPRAIVQGLELMPSPDWMCRSEILLPRLRGLLSDARFEVRTATISGLIRELSLAADAHIPARRYAMDDVWHGMTLGKNGDRHPRRSRRLEDLLVSTEAASAVASLFARPYAQWDLYPTWELEDSWRELLASQHHDNHECEGLCGHVAYATLDRVERLASHVLERSARRLLGPPNLDHPRVLVFNTTGRIRDVEFHEPGSERRVAARDVPPFGFRILDSGGASAVHPIDVVESDDRIELRRGPWSVGVCRATGAIAQVTTPEYPDGLADGSMPVARPVLASAASRPRLQGVSIEREEKTGEQRLVSRFIDEACGSLRMSAHPNSRGIELTLDSDGFICDTPGFAGSLTLDFHTGLHAPAVARDTPYSHEPANNPRPGRRKYPTGDWMTSPQWFEEVEHAFTSLTWVRLRDTRDSRSLVIRHDGSQQWFLHPTLRAVLTARDPWDEPRVNGKFTATFRFEPDGPADPDRPAVVAMNQLPREARSPV